MKKKEYIKPEIAVVLMQEKQTILAGSEVFKASEDDYQEEKVGNYRDESGFIWAD